VGVTERQLGDDCELRDIERFFQRAQARATRLFRMVGRLESRGQLTASEPEQLSPRMPEGEGQPTIHLGGGFQLDPPTGRVPRCATEVRQYRCALVQEGRRPLPSN
jgi:hypothetical protein